ncbi:hypothetical protein MTO96_033335 [Rhipicephalus appendiculatus]
MAGIVDEGTVRLGMNEGGDDLVRRLDALNPETVSELVLSNCVVGEPAQLYTQVRRCVNLRRLRCVACPLQPSQLLQLMLERLQHLEHLELSLVEDSESSVRSETNSVRLIASQKRDFAVTHSLRRLYVEVGGGDRNLELLRELLASCFNLTELHVHLVRGNFSNALSECRRFHDDHVKLETFTLTSEVPVPFPYEPDLSSAFKNCATICANVRHNKSGDWWSCVELDELAYSPDRVLPSPVVVVALITDTTGESFHLASRRNCWARVRELCLMLLPLAPSMKFYPTAGSAYSGNLRRFFSVALEHVVELNLTFSAAQRLLTVCSDLRELDVRIDKRGGEFKCRSCEPLLNKGAFQSPPNGAPLVVRSGVAKLTVCDVPAHVQLWLVECCPVAVTVRLVEWPGNIRSLNSGYLADLFARHGAIRCLVLQHKDLHIKNRQLRVSELVFLAAWSPTSCCQLTSSY